MCERAQVSFRCQGVGRVAMAMATKSMKPRRTKTPEPVIKQLFAEGRGMCANCQTPTDVADLQVDHRRPVHLGGSNDLSNLQFLCSACHQTKTTSELTTN